MGTLTNYYRIVQPASPKQAYTTTDNELVSRYQNYSWYNAVVKSASTRLARYKQYEMMDRDVDISRALDTISEEMSTVDEKTHLPFLISYQNDDNVEVNERLVMTIKAALRHWCDLQDLYNRIFRTCRTTAKMGDCFFRKTSDHRKWEYIDPSLIYGVEMDEKGVIIAYHVRMLGASGTGNSTEQMQIIPAEGMIHFTLSDDMSSVAPFGDSLLEPVVKVFKQMTLLEDAVVIYRIVRAPERRVFYLDVGGMPPHKVKAYLESVKTEMYQKRFANEMGGEAQVDSAYNPQSMTQDFFMATTSEGRGTKIETLPAGEQLGEITDLTYFQNRVARGLRVPTSYLNSQGQGSGQYTDGKVGIAYIEELRFANFVKRLQNKVEKVYDRQFKAYLDASGIKIDHNLFKLQLPEPQNFALYRQAAIDAELINTFNTAENIQYLSKRYILKRFLGFTEDDIQTNEAMLRQERNIPDTTNLDDPPITDIQLMYDPAIYSDRKVDVPSFSGGGGGGGGFGGGMDLGSSPSDLGLEEPGGEGEKPEGEAPEGAESPEAPADTGPELEAPATPEPAPEAPPTA